MRRKRKDEATEGAAPPGAAVEPRRITPVEIQQKEFRVAVRGYKEGEVDAFLDEVTEEVARLYADNKRLREQLEMQGTARIDTGGAVEADAVIRRARDDAARIVAEAEAEARRTRESGLQPAGSGVGAAPPAARATLGPFLAREKEFLQGLASLIQQHAEGVKEDARRARDVQSPANPTIDSTEAEPPASQADHSRGGDEPTRSWEASSVPVSAGRRLDEPVIDLTGNRETAGEASERGALSGRSKAIDDVPDASLRELFLGED
jgi:DivIVA domain-containing protein